MIILKNGVLIGQGTNRACYVHPDDPDKCIKVTISDDPSESEKEAKYYRFLQSREASWDMVARFYGTVETDLGLGYIFDLPKDFDGNISKMIYHYLTSAEITQSIENPLILFETLKNYLLHENIIVKDLNVGNILYQKLTPEKGKLVVIDGIGNNEFFPFSTFIPYFTRKKIRRKWNEFQKSWYTKHKNNQYFLSLLEKSKNSISIGKADVN